MTHRTISKTSARRLAISRQRLAGDPAPATPEGIMEVVRDLGCLQLDPISAVARSQLLVLWSRLGAYEPQWLDELLAEGALFEYWGHAVAFLPIEEYRLHRRHMLERTPRHRDWLAANP
ncbi:MAG: crosslink repair DNA glycosylase YcaQ family protein, partial [Chloroflexota bacterium]